MTDTATTWDVLWSSHFAKLSADEVAVWSHELFKGPDRIRNLTLHELEAAIRAGAKLKHSKYPKLSELRMWIFMERKRVRTAGQDENITCAACDGTGVLHYRESVFADGRREIGEKPGASHQNTAIPCACSLGHRIAERWYSDERVREQILTMSREVIKAK